MEHLEKAGASYYYAKTIVQNKIELAKIELVEKSSDAAGFLMTAIIIGLAIFMVSLGLSALLAFYLATVLQSWIGSLSIIIALWLFIAIGIYRFKEYIIIKPLENILAKSWLS